MKFRSLALLLFGLLLLLVSACAPQEAANPEITLSTDRIHPAGWVTMTGTGFTPMADVESHMRRPDGTEFPILLMLTDAQGGITHQIDTALFDVGRYELWIIDQATDRVSNTAGFEVTLDYQAQ